MKYDAFKRIKQKSVIAGSSQDNHKTLHLEQKPFCQQCNVAGKQAIFRPLVEIFLCDSCYKTQFPATAMCESDETPLAKLDHRIRRKLTEFRDPNAYPEEEECHVCLERGKFRRCCSRYYCRPCYYKSNACPGCKTLNHRSGVNIKTQRPSKTAVLATWGVSFSVLFLIAALIGIVMANYVTKPTTFWGHTCAGWFPSCKKVVCIDFVGDLSNGMPTAYQFCKVDTSENKVIGSSCIFDPELYRWSNESLGFDLCAQQYSNTTELLSQSLNKQGVYIFEDNFDHWTNESDYKSVLMKSAKWQRMENGKASDVCGVNDVHRPYELEHGEFDSSRKNSSLVFSGVMDRYAETMDLDMRHGGLVEFYLKLAPIVENELATECKTSFEGKVSLNYSIDGGFNWQPIRTYTSWQYRNDHFSLVEENLPKDACTKSTRFRWEQSLFDPQRDFWSIDDVRVFSFFDPAYYTSILYDTNREARAETVHQQQCEYDTEQCAFFPNALDGLEFRIRTVDLYITICLVMLLGQKFFQDLHHWRSNAPQICESNDDRSENLAIPLKTEFRYAKCRRWQMFAVATLCAPLCIMTGYLCWHVARWWKTFYSSSAPSAFYIFVSLSVDFLVVRYLGITVFQFWPFYVETRVEIDATNEDELLLLDTCVIPLIDIGMLEMFPKRFFWSLFVVTCFSGFPLSLSLIFIKSLQLPHEDYAIVMHILGMSMLLRSILGPAWAVEVYLSLNAICCFSPVQRDKLGMSFSRPSVAHTTSYTILISLLLALVFFVMSFREHLNGYNTVIFFLCAVFVGVITGSMLGLLRGLPIVPRISLTTWPDDGYSFSHSRKRKQPHFWSIFLAGGTNSCELYILSVEEMDLFRSLLRGDNVGPK